MRKYIIIYIALCLQVAARGQTIADIDLSGLPQPTTAKALRYWIDDDIGSVQTTDILNGQHIVDVSSLLDGLHTIHYQIIDSDDKVAAPYSGIFLKMDGNLSSTTASTLRYWFDSDTNVNTCDANAGVQLLDVSMLLDGLHTLHYQVVDTEGQASYIASGIFLKMEDMAGSGNVTAEELIYWYDDETTTTTIDMVSGIMTMDASDLLDGLHTVHYLVRCSDGSVTSAYSSIFLRMNIDILTTTAQSLRYWFDNDTAVTITEIAQGIQTIDASHLLDGLHTVHYQIVDDSGAVTSPSSSIFLKMTEGIKATAAQSLRYWFDNDTDVRTTSVAGGTQTLDVSGLLPGLHFLHYQLVDSEGQLASPMSGIFLKMFDKPYEDGQNGITKYQYWLNNNSATLRTVTLDAAANPYTLIALLPMQKEPIRSNSFHFETKSGKPMMYAKNDLHVRFTDRAGYFIDDSRQFIDYSVSHEVVPMGELQAAQTFQKVNVNDVRWYTMQVAPGDTAAFKLSQPATVQVFAPSGAEVFKTSESASVKWGGIHTWEDGTYYLAVHDVTGSQSTMKLEYMHMDKYDVVDWDVHTVGNGGCSTITFKGNGFRDLYAVDLVIAPGDTIRSVDVSHDSDAETAVTFDFTAATLGDYNAVFHFTEEDKPVANVVTVEEAIGIELATDVTFPSSFLSGTSTTYTIKITNKGNMTAYAVPIYVYLSSMTTSGISKINIEGLQLKKIYDLVETDSLDEEGKNLLKAFSEEIGEMHYFTAFRVLSEEHSDSITIRTGNFFVDLTPNSTKSININVIASETVSLYITVSKSHPTFSLSDTNVSQVMISRRNSFKTIESYCCERERYECIANVVASAFDLASLISGVLALVTQEVPVLGQVMDVIAGGTAIGSCAMSSFNTFYPPINGIICSNHGGSGNPWKDGFKGFGRGLSIVGALSSCASAYFGKLAKELKGLKDGSSGIVRGIHAFSKAIMDIFSTGASAHSIGVDLLQAAIGDANYDCIFGNTEKKSNCPPNPNHGGGSSSPQPPSDPNDIFGYLSEAGSKFIADSVARVNYTIEFENDTTFTTAAAHTIVIKDTLDSRYFDLTKFMPTGVRIGGHEVFLDEADVVTNNSKTTFVKTIDMRPEINAIAQVDGEFNQKSGIAQWTFQSLDPMTMEPTDDLMQGILPVNYNGTSGIGEVMFEIGVKQGKADGTKIDNRAGIVFDYEEAILTPTWTNIVDAVAPTSIVDGLTLLNDSTLRVYADAEDARSGVWKYEWYVQHGENAPWWKEGETNDDCFDFHFYEGFDYGFCVVVTDSAGNVEQKAVQRERGFKTYGEDFDEAVSLCPTPASPDGDSRIYDLSGRRQDEPQEGVNIINRKKMLFRRKGK